MSLALRTVIQVSCGTPLVRAGIEATLRRHPGFDLCAADTTSGLDDLRREASSSGAFDVLVADYESGIEAAAARSASRSPNASFNILVVTARDSETEIRHALNSGVQGYFLASGRIDEFVDAIRSVGRGQRWLSGVAVRRIADSLSHPDLTSREQDVLGLIARGFPNKAIATRLGITVGTVKTHLRNLFEKLPASSRTEAAAVAERRGLLTPAIATTPPTAASGRERRKPFWAVEAPDCAIGELA